MKRQSWIILAVALTLVGGTSGVLGYWKGNQRLGVPGLKVVPRPTLDRDGNVVATNSLYLPEQLPGYTSEVIPVTKQEIDMLPRDTTYGRRLYKTADGFQVTASVVMMGTDRTSIHKPQYCLTGQGWGIDRSETTTIRIDRPHSYQLPVMKLTATGTGTTSEGEKVQARGVYVYWFVADKELTADHLQRMWWMARDLMKTGTLQRWAYVTYFAICPPGQEEATFQRMKQLIAAAVPEFQLTTGETVSGSVSGSGTPAVP